MESRHGWKTVENAVISSANNSLFEMKNNMGLIMFELTQFMKNNVYYIESEDAYAVADIENARLVLYAVYSERPADLEKIIEAFGSEITEVV